LLVVINKIYLINHQKKRKEKKKKKRKTKKVPSRIWPWPGLAGQAKSSQANKTEERNKWNISKKLEKHGPPWLGLHTSSLFIFIDTLIMNVVDSERFVEPFG
jgi:hypothetical protein